MELVRKHEGRKWAPPGHAGVVSREIVSTAMTAQAATIHVSIMAPGSSSELDAHPHSEQTFFVLAGALRFTDGVVALVAEAGDAVFIPANDPHGIRNDGAVEAVCLVVTAPPLT
ncbi:MAG: hypothetical protein AUK03_16370 [Anaerolineae bacterium CG2_30_64_16]|nr:MAG: hypothetical protein AUK03_16370 [Anaerolineae bacterium CG2_30_64_16]